MNKSTTKLNQITLAENYQSKNNGNRNELVNKDSVSLDFLSTFSYNTIDRCPKFFYLCKKNSLNRFHDKVLDG